MSKDHNKKDCCGGHVGTDCQCGFPAEGILSKDEQEAMDLLRIILAQGQRRKQAKQNLYDEMLADADLTNI